MTTRESSDAPRPRRALTNVGGPARLFGEMEPAARLAEAMAVRSAMEADEEAQPHVHGFHSYPARLHPQTARRLIEAFSGPGATVLDPFCGSGTVLVEARLAGRRAIGVDLNPLAIRLAGLKVRSISSVDRERLLEAAQQVAEAAELRRKARAGSSRRYGHADVALFDPHVLLELDNIRVALDAQSGADADRVRPALELVLSAILTKVSRRRGDTSRETTKRRLASGFATRLFLQKAEDLVERAGAIATQMESAPPADVREGDARRLEGVRPGSVDLIVTSPPYPGVYDYLSHHETRLRWLRLQRSALERAEIGARRHLEPLGPDEALGEWRAQLAAVLTAMSRVLGPAGVAVLVIADSVVAGEPVYALDLLRSTTGVAGLTVAAAASQARPHFHGPTAYAFRRSPRHEHAILLRRREPGPRGPGPTGRRPPRRS